MGRATPPDRAGNSPVGPGNSPVRTRGARPGRRSPLRIRDYPPALKRGSPRRAAHHPLGGFVSLASREAPFRRRHCATAGSPSLAPPGVSAARAPRPSPGHRLRPATSQPARSPPNPAPRPPRVPSPAPSALRPWPGPSPGSPPSRTSPRPPARLRVPAPCGSVPSRWRTVTLTHSARNRKSSPWPNPVESGGKPRKTALSGRRRRGLAGETPPSGGFRSSVGRDNSSVGRGNSPVGRGNSPVGKWRASDWRRQSPPGAAHQQLGGFVQERPLGTAR